jgi:hypothetical protein
MIELLKEKGGGQVIVGDMSGIEHPKLPRENVSGSTDSLMEASGMTVAALAAGGELFAFAGWLIENRLAMPPVAKKPFRDISRLLASFGNRVVVGLWSDWKTALASETLTKSALDSIWDDRVLNHAYQVSGGSPEIALKVVNDLVPYDLQKRLNEMTKPPPD